MQALMAFRARAPLIARTQARNASSVAKPIYAPEFSAMLGKDASTMNQARAKAMAENAKHNAESIHHASETTDTWKKISLFVAIPGVFAIAFYTLFVMDHQHFKSEDDFVQYDHMRKRVKAFPWGTGDDALFKGPNNY
ncbi:hypothetical protein SARC_02399 [Sphaeroforma arctica JP610]|uniref:Cytochrome c oxidase subunit VIa n=1 Tax=Sphaeroforma arctica JP610 TaxID=667725 RepID=A0A0L0G914_9EUKA|nr:hypothetical protein SARC_02399 [Sphaeroforma arctica JP610]KNC85399.1 hypothetical protein SARC_02399 [Sphaeroforma arctica JP610]|eukprot:XP_014159301.1 hypothetical protein SARC_02399 [Sphaeroforma arctica JP610]